MFKRITLVVSDKYGNSVDVAKKVGDGDYRRREYRNITQSSIVRMLRLPVTHPSKIWAGCGAINHSVYVDIFRYGD